MAEHCGLSEEKVLELLDQGKSMRQIIDGVEGNGRTLVRLDIPAFRRGPAKARGDFDFCGAATFSANTALSA